VAKPPRAAPGLAARGGTTVAPHHKGAPCPTGRPAPVRVRLCPKSPHCCCPEHRTAARTAIPNAARGAFYFAVAASSSSARASRASTPPPRRCVPRSPTCGTRSLPPLLGASAALAALCTGLEQRAAATSARKLLELMVDTSQRHRRRPHHTECVAPPSRPSHLDTGPSALRRRLRASASASGAARSAPHPMLCLCYPPRCH
jgi:hypothetical protein